MASKCSQKQASFSQHLPPSLGIDWMGEWEAGGERLPSAALKSRSLHVTSAAAPTESAGNV